MIAVLLACVLVSADVSVPNLAFRVETDLYSGSETQPSVQWITRFEGTIAIDSERDHPELAMLYDFSTGEVTKIDLRQQKKSTVSFGELENYVSNLRLGLTPEAAKSFGADAYPQKLPGDRWQAVLPGWRYDVSGQIEPASQAAQRYAIFANNAARLNVIDHHGRPPFIRIKLNEELAQNRMLPLEIAVSGNVAQKTRHKVSAELTEQDRRQIADIVNAMKKCTEVDWKQLSK